MKDYYVTLPLGFWIWLTATEALQDELEELQGNLE